MSLANVWSALAQVFLIGHFLFDSNLINAPIWRIYKPVLDFFFVYTILKVNRTHRYMLVSV